MEVYRFRYGRGRCIVEAYGVSFGSKAAGSPSAAILSILGISWIDNILRGVRIDNTNSSLLTKEPGLLKELLII